MLVPRHPNPPYLGKIDIAPISDIGYKNTPFSGPSREIFPRPRPQNTPLSRENGKTHAAPLCIRVGGGYGTALYVKVWPSHAQRGVGVCAVPFIFLSHNTLTFKEECSRDFG